MSLRRYLLSTLLGMMALLLLVSTVASYLESRHELEEVFDAQLAQHAKVLRASLAPAIERQAGLLAIESWRGNTDDSAREDDEDERDAFGHDYENKIAFQFWSADGKLQARSDSAPLVPFAPYIAGYSEQNHNEHEWRVFTLGTAAKGWIQVGHRDDVRGELSAEIAMQTIWPGLLLTPVMALIIILVSRQAFRPLHALANTVSERTPEQLEALPTQMAPEEVQPLVNSFNALLERLSETFRQQKRFIADAAHELKTPLAALQVHTENALASTGTEREQALQLVKAGIVRTNRLVEQLLLMSRLEHNRHPNSELGSKRIDIDLGELTQQLFDELTVLARSRQQRFAFNSDEHPVITGSELPARAMLRNLLDNALRYSPAHSIVTVTIARDRNGLTWCVCDQGPGIEPEQRERVFEPFFRELDNQATGSGLGLAIAREAATQLGASIKLSDNTPSGLCVTVHWPHHQSSEG
jgi:two-component system, OmpR family, sensor histidine kinase QseC